MNPHDAKLFRNPAKNHTTSNSTIRSLVRLIKEKQVKNGTLVLRNQTRLTSKTDLFHVMLSQTDMNGADLGSAILMDIILCNTTMPDGSVNDSDC